MRKPSACDRIKLLLLLLVLSCPLPAQSDTIVVGELCSGIRGENIFLEGDFGAGAPNIPSADPGLAPGYRYSTNPPPNDGEYTITNGTSRWGSFAQTWVNIGDRSDDPTGYMMVVNAAEEPGLFYQQQVEVCPETNYEFSIEVISLNRVDGDPNLIAPNISFLINDEVVFNTGEVPIDEEWHKYGFTFTTSATAAIIDLSRRNNALGGLGNDLALDNISFRPCGPDFQLPETVTTCSSRGVELVATQDTVQGFTFQWELSTDTGISWQQIPGASGTSLFLNDPRDGDLFRARVSPNDPDLQADACMYLAGPALIERRRIRDTIRAVLCPGDSLQVEDTTLYSAASLSYDFITDDGCDSSLTYIITEEDFSSYGINGPATICPGTEASIRGQGPIRAYAWSTGSLQPSIRVGPGTYALTYTTANGCLGTSSATLRSAPLEVQLGTRDPACQGSANGLIVVDSVWGGAGGYQASLQGQRAAPRAVFDELPVGTYMLLIEDSLGCELEKTLTLEAPPPFEVDLPERIELDIGDSLQLGVGVSVPLDSIVWIPPEGLSCDDCLQPLLRAGDVDTYRLVLQDQQGCRVERTLEVLVDSRLQLYVPNAFSPNGDGQNDRFYPQGGNGVDLVQEFAVFDRWGGLLFQRLGTQISDETLRWNGQQAGEPVAPGTYLWMLRVKLLDGRTATISGTVSLLR